MHNFVYISVIYLKRLFFVLAERQFKWCYNHVLDNSQTVLYVIRTKYALIMVYNILNFSGRLCLFSYSVLSNDGHVLTFSVVGRLTVVL